MDKWISQFSFNVKDLIGDYKQPDEEELPNTDGIIIRENEDVESRILSLIHEFVNTDDNDDNIIKYLAEILSQFDIKKLSNPRIFTIEGFHLKLLARLKLGTVNKDFIRLLSIVTKEDYIAYELVENGILSMINALISGKKDFDILNLLLDTLLNSINYLHQIDPLCIASIDFSILPTVLFPVHCLKFMCQLSKYAKDTVPAFKIINFSLSFESRNFEICYYYMWIAYYLITNNLKNIDVCKAIIVFESQDSLIPRSLKFVDPDHGEIIPPYIQIVIRLLQSNLNLADISSIIIFNLFLDILSPDHPNTILTIQAIYMLAKRSLINQSFFNDERFVNGIIGNLTQNDFRTKLSCLKLLALILPSCPIEFCFLIIDEAFNEIADLAEVNQDSSIIPYDVIDILLRRTIQTDYQPKFLEILEEIEYHELLDEASSMAMYEIQICQYTKNYEDAVDNWKQSQSI